VPPPRSWCSPNLGVSFEVTLLRLVMEHCLSIAHTAGCCFRHAHESLGKAATGFSAKGVVKLSARPMRLEIPLERGGGDSNDGVGSPQQKRSPRGMCFGHRAPSRSQWLFLLGVLQEALRRGGNFTCRAFR